jgi:hypothetical protein
MEYQKYVDMFWCDVGAIFCIVDFDPSDCTFQADYKKLQGEFQRLGLDDKVIFHHVMEGSIFDQSVYLRAVQDVCKIAPSVCLDDKQPISIFKGHVRFIDHNMRMLIRVSTALNIHRHFWDIFSLSCDEVIYNKDVLKGDVYFGSTKGDNALLLAPQVIKQLATLNKKETSLQVFIDKKCKRQLVLAHPLCYQWKHQVLDTVLFKADIALTVWRTMGKFIPLSIIQKYIYYRAIETYRDI